MITRNQYLERLISFRDKRLIKIITGIRRCGKSTLFELFQTYLRQNGVAQEQMPGEKWTNERCWICRNWL